MPLYAASGGGWKTPRGMRVGGSAVRNVWVATGGLWRNVWSAFSASASGGSFERNIGNANTPRTVATSVGVTAFPNGGSGNYAYSWSIVSSSGVTGISLSNASSQGATVNATCTLNGGGSVSLQCVVTDISFGLTAVVTTSTSYNYYNTL